VAGPVTVDGEQEAQGDHDDAEEQVQPVGGVVVRDEVGRGSVVGDQSVGFGPIVP
jgi:hypothetical protein